MKSLFIVPLVTALSLVALVESTEVVASEITLNYAFFAPNGTFPAQQMNYWAKELESRTEGAVEVNTFPGGTLLGARDMYNGVTQGIVDIGLGSPSGDPGRFPVSSVMTLPLGIPNAKVASLAYDELMRDLQPEEMSKFKVLAFFTSEPVYIQTRQAAGNLDDFKSIKLGGAGSFMPAVSSLGASPVAMLMPSVTEALPTGVIDGVVTSREVLKDFKLAEYIDYVVDYPLGVVTFAAVMTKEKWESLPREVQEVMEELAAEMPLWIGRYHDGAVKSALEWSQEKHGLAIAELEEKERVVWGERLKHLVENWRSEMMSKGLPASDILSKVESIIEKHLESDLN
ncbi:TRAP transporter substrate-binding protein [Marinobacterium aestuariivivens]|uniref:TRAP transporter substrate-binding protein n=1 Tax=Marinobacterium aestuariivivens TaxID=1698799 RepID=A0ABW2AAN3_9GAMM